MDRGRFRIEMVRESDKQAADARMMCMTIGAGSLGDATDIASASGLAAGVRPLLQAVFAYGADDAFTARRMSAQVEQLLGALGYSCVVIVDECFSDLSAIQDGQQDVGFSTVIDGLPAQKPGTYDVAFVRRFLLTLAGITTRIASGWSAPGCVAEELALRLLLDQVDLTAALFALDLPKNWRSILEDTLFDDLDHEHLYKDQLSADDTLRLLGVAPLALDQWFAPFTPDAVRIPYVIDPN
jgi:hypothetical protein